MTYPTESGNAEHNGWSTSREQGGYWSSLAIADDSGEVLALVLNGKAEDEAEALQNANGLFIVEVANKATEIITGYQDLLRQMANAMEENDRVLAALPSLKAVTFTEAELDMMRRIACPKKLALAKARAALPAV